MTPVPHPLEVAGRPIGLGWPTSPSADVSRETSGHPVGLGWPTQTAAGDVQ